MAAGIDPKSVRLTTLSDGPLTAGWFWSARGGEIWFYDNPPGGPSGTWAVDVVTRRRRHISALWGRYSPSRRYVFTREAGSLGTTVHDRGAASRWYLNDTGDGIVVDPTESAAAFGVRRWGVYDAPWLRPADIYRMGLDGGDRTAIARIVGRVLGWRSDGGVLVAGRNDLNEPVVVRAVDESGEVLSRWTLGERARDLRLSPDGRFLAFAVVHAEPGAGGQFGIDLFSGRRWRLPGPASVRWMPDGSGLLLIPARRALPRSFKVQQLDFSSRGVARALTDPRRHPVDLESFDWEISPSAAALAFRGARDLRLHLLTWRHPRTPDLYPGVGPL